MRGVCLLLFGLCGCAEAPLEAAFAEPFRPESPPIQQSAELAPPGDSFWLAEAVTEARKPPPARARSISLGYVGNAPLVGGVMRDTPMPANDAVNDPRMTEPARPTCSCGLADR